jgi:hypothetical protein
LWISSQNMKGNLGYSVSAVIDPLGAYSTYIFLLF